MSSKADRQFFETRLSLIEYAHDHTLDELLTEALDIVGAYVNSPIGFYHFVEPDQVNLNLQQWSTRTKAEFCKVERQETHYPIDQAGVWVECVYTKKPVIHNDYASLTNKKGIPEGHAEIVRELVIPVMRDGLVMAILGVGNKPTDYNDDDVEIVSYLADVTWEIVQNKRTIEALQQSEDRLQKIMLAANDGMWDWNLQTNEVYFDPRYYEMAGYEKDEFSHILEEFQSRVHPDDVEYVMGQAEKHLKGEIERFIVEFRFKKKDGSWLWIMGRGVIVEWSEDGKPLRFIGTHTDISRLKNVELELMAKNIELEKARVKAEESDSLKSAFLANMSHEIRTPMNGILGFASLLKTPQLTGEEKDQYISIIEKSGARMLNIINDLVDISKIEAGQVDISVSDTNINKQIADIYNFLMPEVKQRELMFALTETLPDSEATIRTDQDKLYTILINLVKNSIKYTHKGKIELGYHLVNKEIEFFVRDTGIGIAKDQHESIFDRFVQADLTMTKPYEGAGLGLAITKAYVEMLGGKIRVESKEGSGSAFYFTIPYIPSTTDSIRLTKPLIDSKLEEVYKNITVLIVDDDETAVIYLSELLKGKCKKIIHAGTGTEAVNFCKANNNINLVMMDIKMPDMDGYTATKLIREFNKEVIIIAQTAYALLGDREKSIQAGCNDYLAKPIRSEDFFNVVGKHLSNLQL